MSVAEELAKLHSLKEQGVITEEEFQRSKNRLLGQGAKLEGNSGGKHPKTESEYDALPFYRKHFIGVLSFLLFCPALFLILTTGNVFYKKKGEVKQWPNVARIVMIVISGIITILFGFELAGLDRIDLFGVNRTTSCSELAPKVVSLSEENTNLIDKNKIIEITNLKKIPKTEFDQDMPGEIAINCMGDAYYSDGSKKIINFYATSTASESYIGFNENDPIDSTTVNHLDRSDDSQIQGAAKTEKIITTQWSSSFHQGSTEYFLGENSASGNYVALACSPYAAASISVVINGEQMAPDEMVFTIDGTETQKIGWMFSGCNACNSNKLAFLQALRSSNKISVKASSRSITFLSNNSSKIISEEDLEICSVIVN